MTCKPRDTRAAQQPWNSLAETSTGHSNEDMSIDTSTTATPADESSQSDMRHSDS